MTCPNCKTEDVPKDAMVYLDGKVVCVACDFESFLLSDGDEAEANKTMFRLIADLFGGVN